MVRVDTKILQIFEKFSVPNSMMFQQGVSRVIHCLTRFTSFLSNLYGLGLV